VIQEVLHRVALLVHRLGKDLCKSRHAREVVALERRELPQRAVERARRGRVGLGVVVGVCAARAARRESVRARGRERRARARTLQKGKGKEGEEEGTSDAPFDQSYSSSSSDARWINGMHDGWRLSKL